jgi:predicted nucleotidyltransferase component of viral defense system
MIIPRTEDVLHRVWLFRLLTEIVDNRILSQALIFKGGTCATMLGFLDRFSVDLDFDLVDPKNEQLVRRELHEIFENLGLSIKDESKKVPQFFLGYPVPKQNQRNTLKLDILPHPPKLNKYAPQFLVEIDRMANCQTIETMFANKLVALMDRHEKNTTIAGRDVYDIHHFFLSGYEYNQEVITERTGLTTTDFLMKLSSFIEKYITQSLLERDLNALLPLDTFRQTVKHLKQETLDFLRVEIEKQKIKK